MIAALRGGVSLRRRQGDLDGRRERRVELLLILVERFVYDLGLLIAGAGTGLDDYVCEEVRTRLLEALRPLRESGCTVRPEFGEYAQVRIEGNLLDPAAPVRAAVEFEDRSTRFSAEGSPLPRTRRRVRLLLIADPFITTIIDHRVEAV